MLNWICLWGKLESIIYHYVFFNLDDIHLQKYTELSPRKYKLLAVPNERAQLLKVL